LLFVNTACESSTVIASWCRGYVERGVFYERYVTVFSSERNFGLNYGL
jgi:hypothetical protein